MVLNRIKALFDQPMHPKEVPHDQTLRLSAAALLVESAVQDRDFDGRERAVIERVLTERFGLSPMELETLLKDAEEKVHESSGIYAFTRDVRHNMEEDDRIGIIEMLWEVAYADDELHEFEDSLIRRVAGMLGVSDQDRGAARKRVLDRRG